MELILVLDNIRSSYNVGAILRTAEGLGVQKVIFSGVTPSPVGKPGQLPHVQQKELRAIRKTALGAEEMVTCEYVEDVAGELRKLRECGYTVAGLENNLRDERLVTLGTVDLGERAALILGEEVSGISPRLYGEVDYFLEIPMVGRKESLNVSVAAGIAIYALLGQ